MLSCPARHLVLSNRSSNLDGKKETMTTIKWGNGENEMNIEEMQQMVNDAYETGQPYSYLVMAFEEAFRQAQQDAYEEAANICDKMKEKAYEDGEGSTDIPAWINNCSNIIRALKAKKGR